MCLCVYVSMCLCVYVSMCMSDTDMWLCLTLCVYVYVSMCPCVYVYMCLCAYNGIRVDVYEGGRGMSGDVV